MKVNLSMDFQKDMEEKFFHQENFMKDNIKQIKKMEQESFSIEKDKYMMANGNKVNAMDWDLFITMMVEYIKVCGKMTKNMEKVKLLIKMEIFLKQETGLMGYSNHEERALMHKKFIFFKINT